MVDYRFAGADRGAVGLAQLSAHGRRRGSALAPAERHRRSNARYGGNRDAWGTEGGRRAPPRRLQPCRFVCEMVIEIRLGGDLDRFMNDIYRSGDLQAATGETAPALERAWTRTLDDQ